MAQQLHSISPAKLVQFYYFFYCFFFWLNNFHLLFTDEETHCYHNQRLSQSIYSLEPSQVDAVAAAAAANGKPFPLTNGSLFAHLMNPATNDARGTELPRVWLLIDVLIGF